jgi:hypothetical protein
VSHEHPFLYPAVPTHSCLVCPHAATPCVLAAADEGTAMAMLKVAMYGTRGERVADHIVSTSVALDVFPSQVSLRAVVFVAHVGAALDATCS